MLKIQMVQLFSNKTHLIHKHSDRTHNFHLPKELFFEGFVQIKCIQS